MLIRVAVLIVLCVFQGCGAQEHVYRRTLPQAYQEGVQFLLSRQNKDGSFGSARQSHGFDVPVVAPDSYWAEQVSCTALAVMALQRPATGDPRIAASRERAIRYLIEQGRVYRAAPGELYNVWTHAYVIQALAGVLHDDPRREGARWALSWHLGMLEKLETMWGGWQYYDTFGAVHPALEPTSFTTATALVSFRAASDVGIEVPERLIRRAMKIVLECRMPDGRYCYDWAMIQRPEREINQVKSNISRVQPCNLALWLWDGPVTASQVRRDLDLFFREHKWLDIARKRPIPHEGWYAHAGYFYYYSHYYAALNIQRLGAFDRTRFATQLVEAIVPYQESDGSWWDFPEFSYDKVYGTALALLALEAFI